MEFLPFYFYGGELFIGDLLFDWVEVFVECGSDFKAGFGGFIDFLELEILHVASSVR